MATRSGSLAELRKRLVGWCTDQDGLVVTADGKDDEHDLLLEIEERSGTAVPLTVARRTRGDRLIVSTEVAVRAATVDPPDEDLPSFADVLERLLDGRPATVTGRVTRRRDAYRVSVEGAVHLEGLTRQDFAGVLAEVSRTRRLVDRSAADARIQREILDRLSAIGRPREPGSQVESQPPPAAQPPAETPAQQAWSPTHVVPPEGLPAWATPDPAAAPVAQLAGGVELVIEEWWGAWAQVRGSNGWTGWVDGRRLLG